MGQAGVSLELSHRPLPWLGLATQVRLPGLGRGSGRGKGLGGGTWGQEAPEDRYCLVSRQDRDQGQVRGWAVGPRLWVEVQALGPGDWGSKTAEDTEMLAGGRIENWAQGTSL